MHGELVERSAIYARRLNEQIARAPTATDDQITSSVIETLTSEVDTMSMGVSCLSKTAKRRERNPCAISMRSEVTLMTVMPRLKAMDLITARECGAPRTIDLSYHVRF